MQDPQIIFLKDKDERIGSNFGNKVDRVSSDEVIKCVILSNKN